VLFNSRESCAGVKVRWSHLWVVLQCDACVVKLEPLLAIRPDVGVVVTTMDTTTVHQHTVQPVQVAHTAVSLSGTGSSSRATSQTR
jgi:hypothetical protein